MIVLIPHAHKILLVIILECLKSFLEQEIAKEQIGFRSGYDPSPAVIKSRPEHTSNKTGGIVVLSCEVMGNPVPNVIWMKTNVNNKTIQVPDDDSSISSLIRGGPEPHEKTAWIQIINLHKVHEADYTCVAFNELGKDKATARVKVKDGEHKRRRTKRKNPEVN
ncbi:insulin-like growth factor-binding protein-related protein 1 [Octopus bimaculoides]|uniref:insulin-like growth factor-binding protein-related protein 1 n=1 Tax=Octopus bimaculoides TaxID=37653 RepID=UPI0022E4DBB2|nr:insulin-like growth factor-binding protein-related protein 1 [Octopus bimaculoides]